MNLLREKLSLSPIHARVIPYILILVLTFLQDSFGEEARYWMYFAKMLAGAWCIWEMRALVPEMKWAFSWEAVAAGVLVWAIWVFLDPFYPKFEALFKMPPPWNPFHQFGDGSAMGWFFFWVRTLGSALIVPPLEEVFYRSFLYRYCVRTDFENMPLNRFHPTSFIVISLVFGMIHFQWIAGFLCGMIYQWLVIRKNRLGDAMLAHGITNFLLGLWIYWKGDWKFW
jgi:CAAX prenyl protease-like protein